MIDRIKISNFKQFNTLELDKLKAINLISGKNNTGKTSILEAIFMFYDRQSAEITIKQLAWRGIHNISLSPQMMWHHLFHKYEPNKKIEIEINDSGHIEKAVIASTFTNSFEFNEKIKNEPNSPSSLQSNNAPLASLVTEYFSDKKPIGTTTLVTNSQNLQLKVKNLTPPRRQVVIIHSTTKNNSAFDCERYSTLDIESRNSEVLELVQIIEPRIRSLSVAMHGETSYLYAQTDLDRKIPLYLMGEGTAKFVSIILTILTSQNAVICIDEIENGIHYSMFKKMWEIINTCCKKYNCQIFATTHSYDCLRGLSDYAVESNSSNISYIRLDKDSGKVVPKSYSSDMINSAVEFGWEVR